MASTTTGTCLQGSLSTCAFLTPLCLPKARLTEPTVVRPRPVMVNTIVFTTTYPGVLGSNTFIPLQNLQRWRRRTSTALRLPSFGRASWFPQHQGQLMRVSSSSRDAVRSFLQQRGAAITLTFRKQLSGLEALRSQS